MTDMLPGLQGLKAGRKHQYLVHHQDEILAYAEAHGERAARQRYNIKNKLAWNGLLRPIRRQPKSFTKADRAISRAEVAEEVARDAKRDVNELRELYGRFVPLLAEQITDKFFKPLLSGKIELPPELEARPKPDPLDLDNFPGKLNK